MDETGKITSTYNNLAKIEITPNASCEKCKICDIGENGQRIVEATNSIKAQVGNIVKLEMNSTIITKAAFIMYLLPLILMFIGFAVGNKLAIILNLEKYLELFVAIFGIISLLGAYLGIKIYDRKISLTTKFKPKITQIIK